MLSGVIIHAGPLKNMKSKYVGSRGVFINDYFPPTSWEKRKREQEIFDQYQEEDDAVGYQRGGLCIKGELYRKKIMPPTPKQLIEIDPDDMEEIFKLKLFKGKPQYKDNSTFMGYCTDVDTLDEVNRLYIKLKLIQPAARHIVCAYWVDHPEKCYSMDFQDDGEPGAGRVLLDILTSNNLKGKVIFVARKFGGIKMGADRFVCYSNAGKIAAGIDLNIQVNDQSSNQDVQPSGTQNENQQENQYKNQGWRGRGRGGRRGRGRAGSRHMPNPMFNNNRGASGFFRQQRYVGYHGPSAHQMRGAYQYDPPIRGNSHRHSKQQYGSVYNQYRHSLFPSSFKNDSEVSANNSDVESTSSSIPRFLERWSSKDDGAFETNTENTLQKTV